MSWYSQLDTAKATKEGRLPSARGQARDHLYLGARSATLLWITVTEPVEIPGYHPWMAASSRGTKAWDAFRGLRGYQELAAKTDDPVGFVLLPWGAVAGGSTEDFAGAGGPQIERVSALNPYLAEDSVVAAHAHVSNTIARVFGEYRFPDFIAGLVQVISCITCRQLFTSMGAPVPIECVQCRDREQERGL